MEPVAVPIYFANWLRRTYSEKKSLSQISGVKPGLAGVTFMSAMVVHPVAEVGEVAVQVFRNARDLGDRRRPI
jgi:hypothetical protein